jgi:tRNA-Thr(GGU) m(6)t(6)A37 methyltransferase TsaA
MKFDPIGWVSSCFKEKFGIPRQPRMAPAARAVVTLRPWPDMRRALRGLEGFSHLWIVFLFHQITPGWKPVIRPPRLGGKNTVGVFATRSPHRPNPIGISAVELERVDFDLLQVHVKGVDLLDRTPVLDIKPYLPYADSIPRAATGWAEGSTPKLKVRFSPAASKACRGNPTLRALITQMLRCDPRPGFQRKGSGSYAARILDVDVHWESKADACFVRDIKALPPSP